MVSLWLMSTRTDLYNVQQLQNMSDILLLLCFLRLKESTFETGKKVFYSSSKATFFLEILIY